MGLDDKTFSKALRAYERKNRGWIDGGIGMQIRVLLNGAEVSTVNRAHRKRGVIEVAILDSNGHLVIAGDQVYARQSEVDAISKGRSMTVYRDAGHCIARVMSIETNTCTAQSAWQRLYDSGLKEVPEPGCGLSAEERLTQDAMTRALLRRELPKAQWHALVAKYSINDHEVRESIRWLIGRIETPAHHLFKMKSVMAWAVPKRLPEAFYNLSTWDNDGKPESTLRRWRLGVNGWLSKQIEEAHKNIETLLEGEGLLLGGAA